MQNFLLKLLSFKLILVLGNGYVTAASICCKKAMRFTELPMDFSKSKYFLDSFLLLE